MLASVAAAVLVVACGGHTSTPAGAQPEASAQKMVAGFMKAVSDSNISKIAELWGSSKGSAAATGQPSDYERRVVIMQSYLRHDDYRVTADVAEGTDRRSLQVELRRQACTWVVPFTVVKADKGGWLVSNVDLTRAGNPVRPCDPNAPKDSTAKP